MVKRSLIAVFVLLNIYSSAKAQDYLVRGSESVGDSYIIKEVVSDGNPWAMPEYGSSQQQRPSAKPVQKRPRYITPEEIMSLDKPLEEKSDDSQDAMLLYRNKPDHPGARYITPEELEALGKLPKEKRDYSSYRMYRGNPAYQRPRGSFNDYFGGYGSSFYPPVGGYRPYGY